MYEPLICSLSMENLGGESLSSGDYSKKKKRLQESTHSSAILAIAMYTN
jgi:hypothetical protein